MISYYGSSISENMVKTPEGFLICKNVPIARTGKQEYLRSELGYTDGDPNELIPVYRTAEEVFSPATIASFEGKPVCNDHPPVGVDIQNITAYSMGHIQNVHRGVGSEKDLLIADLFITDPGLIDSIRRGMREVSCGYEADYVDDEYGRIFQSRIRGNHVAVVPAGRAGSRVAIKDSRIPESILNRTHERRAHTMPKRNKPSLMAVLFSRAVKDMEPDEVADAVEEMVNASSEDEEPPFPPEQSSTDAELPPPGNEQKPTGDNDQLMQQLLTAITALTRQLNGANAPLGTDADPAAQQSQPQAQDAEDDPLKKLADEIAATDPAVKKEAPPPADQEAAVTVPAEDELPDETQDEDGPTAAASTLPENPIPGTDHAAMTYAYAAINAVRPVIATLPPAQRKLASDRAAIQLRRMLGMPDRSRYNGYAGITNTMRQAAGARMKDSRPRADNGELGRKIMATRNPHYMKKS